MAPVRPAVWEYGNYQVSKSVMYVKTTHHLQSITPTLASESESITSPQALNADPTQGGQAPTADPTQGGQD